MTDDNLRVTITADVSRFQDAMKRAARAMEHYADTVLRTETEIGTFIDRVVRGRTRRDALSLGQVVCPGDRINARMHEFWILSGQACPSCRAAV